MLVLMMDVVEVEIEVVEADRAVGSSEERKSSGGERECVCACVGVAWVSSRLGWWFGGDKCYSGVFELVRE
jgi:hypothetical protein